MIRLYTHRHGGRDCVRPQVNYRHRVGDYVGDVCERSCRVYCHIPRVRTYWQGSCDRGGTCRTGHCTDKPRSQQQHRQCGKERTSANRLKNQHHELPTTGGLHPAREFSPSVIRGTQAPPSAKHEHTYPIGDAMTGPRIRRDSTASWLTQPRTFPLLNYPMAVTENWG